MAFERLLPAVAPQSFTSDGSTTGLITVKDTRGFKVKAKAAISCPGQKDLSVQINRVLSDTQLIVSLAGTRITDRSLDLSAYTAAAGSYIYAEEQPKASVPRDDRDEATYDQEPTVAWRSVMVDQLGRYYETANPLPVRLTDGSVNIGTVNAEVNVALSAVDGAKAPGTIHDSVRIGNGTTEIKIDPNGSQRTVLTNPTDGSLSASITGYNRLRTSPEGTCQFIDHFNFIDVNKWSSGSTNGGSVTYGAASAILNTGTQANAQASLTSVPKFEQQGNVFLEFGCNIKVEAYPFLLGVYRFWGVGNSPSTGSTYSNPLQDGMGFELDGTGAFAAVIYAAGVKVFRQTIAIPSDGLLHRYAFYYNTQFQYWYGQGLDVPLATNTSGNGLTTQILPLKLLMINGHTALTTAPSYSCAAIAVTDTGRNNSAISDGTYPFRKAQVNAQGSLQISGEGSDGRVKTGSESLLFFDAIEGTTINPNLWGQKTLGMTIAQGNDVQTLNANSNAAAGSYAILQTNKYMPLLIEFPLYCQFRAKVIYSLGSVLEMGLFNLSSNTGAPVDGAFLRWDASGNGYAVISNSGVETLTPLGVSIPANLFYNYEFTIYEDHVEFEATATTVNSPSFSIVVPIPGTQGAALGTNHVQAAARVYNTAATASGSKIIISGVNCQQMDLASNRSYREQLAVSAGRGSYQYPVAPFTNTSNLTYNTATPLAVLSDITPSYTTLGGAFYFNLPAASDAQDYALFAFQVPQGHQLNITEVTIDACISASLGGPAIIQWCMGVNSTGASLATANNPSAGSIAPRIVPLGQRSFGGNNTSTGPGNAAPEISLSIDPGLSVDSGRYVHLIIKLPISTGAGSLRGMATIRGYFE